MIIPGWLTALIMVVGLYAVTAVGWLAFFTSLARANYDKAVRWRDRYGLSDSDVKELVEGSEEAAQLARRAWYWLPWIVYAAVQHAREALAGNRRLIDGSTELQRAMRELEIKRLETEIDRMKREQEQTPPSPGVTVREGQPLSRRLRSVFDQPPWRR